MQTGAFLLVGLFLAVFQTTLMQSMPTWLGSPDLMFILVVFIAYRFDSIRGFFLAFLFGWMMDVVSSLYLGAFVLEYLLVFVVINTLTKNSPIKESAYQVPLVGLSYFIAQFLLYASLTMMVDETLAAWSWSRMLREAIIVTVATIPCFILFNSLFEYLLKRKTTSRVARRKTGNRFR
jgi:rod shape-determining protein MreD